MSNRPEPQVLDGLHGPTVAPSAPQPETAPAAPFARPKKKTPPPPDPDLVRYNSRYLGYRVQITAPADVFEPATGRVIRARPVVAQFSAGRYETKDPEIIAVLDKSARCGLGLDFWRAELQEKANAAKAVAAAVTAINSVTGLTPEQKATVEALTGVLQESMVGTGFELPPAHIGALPGV